MTGLEPVTYYKVCSTIWSTWAKAGDEARTRDPAGRLMLYQLSYPAERWWERLDLNQCRLSRLVYSPFPLTTRAHSGIYSNVSERFKSQVNFKSYNVLYYINLDLLCKNVS